MNFKADWSFLEKVSMGATASKAVINLLNNSGHDVIELERYSTKNKIYNKFRPVHMRRFFKRTTES